MFIKWVTKTGKSIKDLTILLCCPPKVEVKNLLLNIPLTLLAIYRKIKLEWSWEVFIMLKGAMCSSRGKYSMALHSYEAMVLANIYHLPRYQRNLGEMINYGTYYHTKAHADLQAHSVPGTPLSSSHLTPTQNLSSPWPLLLFPRLLISI